MKLDKLEEVVEIPEGCTLTLENGVFNVKGEKGEVSKKMFSPRIIITQENNLVKFFSKKASQNEKKLINTFKAHLNNLFRGVQEGFLYKLKICSGHFPMTVAINGEVFEIKNFIGEKVPRRVKIMPNTTVKIDGTEVVVEALNREDAGQMAAKIEQLTKRPGFDKRIFQDGIYITEKPSNK